MAEKKRDLVFYRHYFEEFFDLQTAKVKEKIDFVLFMVTHADYVPEKFLKHIEGQKGLYEIRVEVGNTYFGSSAVLIKGKSLFFLMAFRKKRRKRQRIK